LAGGKQQDRSQGPSTEEVLEMKQKAITIWLDSDLSSWLEKQPRSFKISPLVRTLLHDYLEDDKHGKEAKA
jgi:hypothetical protein